MTYPDWMYTRKRILEQVYGKRWEDCWGEWAQALEDGVAEMVKPDISGEIPSKEKVNFFIDDLMNWFWEQLEKDPEYWRQRGIDRPPAFDTLSGSAKLSFYQDMRAALRDWQLEDL